MKKIMLIGSVGCGKTTLTQRLKGSELTYKKTQAIQFHTDIIDTPGEFIQHRNLYSALITTAINAKVIVLMASALEKKQIFSPQFASAFNKPCIGLVTKIDLANEAQIEWTMKQLQLAGASTVFPISAVTGFGVEEVIDYLSEEDSP